MSASATAGRLRVKLAALLTEAGYPVGPGDLDWQRGYYVQQDGARWFTTGLHGLYLYSWDTMTTCVRRGIVVANTGYHDPYGWHEVHARAEGKGR